MIENLTVENYRSFKTYSMQGLKRVNLLTGYNNSGKTSLLEAVEILASSGRPKCLLSILRRREEFLQFEDSTNTLIGDPVHLFFLRDMDLTLRILSNDWSVSMSLPQRASSPAIQDDYGDLQIERLGTGIKYPDISLPLGRDSAFGILRGRPNWGRAHRSEECFTRVEFVGTLKPEAAKMAVLWDEILVSKSELGVVDALRILDKKVESVVYLASDRTQGRMYIGRSDVSDRSPIGSNGEGMQRLLNLSISLATVNNGILLVDEIDTGLHYSVLADMWKLVIATAIKNDIQVFATTHSLDCLRGLNEACERNPEFATEVSTQTIDRSLDVAIAGDAADLRSALDLGIEVR